MPSSVAVLCRGLVWPWPQPRRRRPVWLSTAVLRVVLNAPQCFCTLENLTSRGFITVITLHPASSVQQIPLQYLQGLPPFARVGLMRQHPFALHIASNSSGFIIAACPTCKKGSAPESTVQEPKKPLLATTYACMQELYQNATEIGI